MIYIFLATIFYAIAIIFGTAAARNINSNLSAGITNIISAILPIAIAAPLISKKTLVSHKFGVLMAIGCGVFIAFFTMAINKSYALNKVGVVAPIVFGGAIVLSTLLSTVVFKEKMSFTEGLGLLVVAIGFGIVIYARAVVK